jgi:hypothetical protein
LRSMLRGSRIAIPLGNSRHLIKIRTNLPLIPHLIIRFSHRYAFLFSIMTGLKKNFHSVLNQFSFKASLI